MTMTKPSPLANDLPKQNPHTPPNHTQSASMVQQGISKNGWHTGLIPAFAPQVCWEYYSNYLHTPTHTPTNRYPLIVGGCLGVTNPLPS